MMRQRRVERYEAELEAEMRAKFKGTARIRLECLDFPKYGRNENAERLKLCIEYGGCYRLGSQYHVIAVIDQSLLDNAIQAANTSHAALLSNAQNQWPALRLPPGVQLHCLRGWDRLRAGWELLPPKDRWWTVDLYRSDLSETVKRYLEEASSNERRPSDGQIYRNIRRYSLEGDLEAEGQWWAHLSKNKRRDLKRLLRHERYTEALDPLLKFGGLWDGDGVKGGMWKKVMDLRCEEEVIHYWEHMDSFWSNLLQNNPHWMRKLDDITVKALERKAPGTSVIDLAYLYGKIQKGAIFHNFSEQERNTIIDALRSVDGLVPSFDTFFEDFKCLRIWGQCAKILKRVPPRGTVFTALEQSYDDSNQQVDECIVQKAESVFTTIPGTVIGRVDLGYRQLFLYVMRHHREMIPGSTKMELKGTKKPAEGIHIPEQVDQLAWCRFATLADRLGFASAEIASLKSMGDAAADVASEQTQPSFITAQPGESEERRSGRPYDLAYEQSRDGLFLDSVQSTDKSQGRGITPFFVRRSIYRAFLGRLAFTGQTGAPRTPTRIFEWRPEAMRDHVMREQDPSPEGAIPQGISHDEAIQEDAASECTALSQSSQGPFPEETRKETREEARPMLDDRILPQEYSPDWDALREEINERLETPHGYIDWGSKPIDGSSCYSTEDEGFQAAAPTHAEEESPVAGIADSVKVRVKFILRDGHDWVEMEELSIHPSDPSPVERVAEMHTRNRRFLFNTTLRSLAPSECFEAIVSDGTNVVLMIPEGSVNIDLEGSRSAWRPGVS